MPVLNQVTNIRDTKASTNKDEGEDTAHDEDPRSYVMRNEF